jgi:flavodoxin I
MKAWIVFDSRYGNTEKVARTVAGALRSRYEIEVYGVGEVDAEKMAGVKLLVLGSPTHGGRPTQAITEFLDRIPKEYLKTIRLACFDTRIAGEGVNAWLRVLMKIIGYAAPKMEKAWLKRDGRLAVPAAGFVVADKEGPLKPGELERAADWLKDK